MASLLTVVASILNVPIQDFSMSVQGNIALRQLIPDFTRQVEHCYSSPGFTDPELGTFKAEYSQSCLQPSRCAPEKPENIHTTFLLFLRNNPSRVFKIDHTDFWVSSELKGKVTFFVNGFFSDYKSSKDSNQTVYGYINSPKFDTDVILVDYFHGAVYRDQAVANTRTIGALLGQLISDLNIVGKSVCVGFSLGAHICGFAGQWLQTHRGLTLPSCIAIDPSGPGFEGCPDHLKLSKGDCKIISVLHGSYNPTQGRIYGTKEKSGNCDFYVNYGEREPGCPNADPQDFIKSIGTISFDNFVSGVKQVTACDHIKTLELFDRLLLTGTRIPAIKCISNNPSNSRRTMLLPPFNMCTRRDDSSYCLDINKLP